MQDQNKNLILATALSFLVILVWFLLFPPPDPVPEPTSDPVAEQMGDGLALAPPADPSAPADPAQAAVPEEVTRETPRVRIDTPRLTGSVSLLGGRLDDLSLRDYRETLDEASDIVHLFSPVGGPRAPYYALHGWAPGGGLSYDDVPGANTLWEQVGSNALAPGSPVVLRWENENGLAFTRRIEVDDNYLFTIVQSVANNGETPARLAPYGIIARHGVPDDLSNFFILHEGMIQMADGSLTEDSYKNMADYRMVEREAARAAITEVEENGWIGFTDKYWMATLVPSPGEAFVAVSKYVSGPEIYQTEIRQQARSIAPGESIEASSMLFAGAKEWETIREYEREGGIERFLDSIDWGWFFFLTKPIFAVLHFLNGIVGNMGWSIIGLTLLIKALLLPLAWKSYVSMAKMKELQPEMAKIKERVGDDRQKLQQEMMTLYKEKKVNPAAGCLPILLQIPIFFSLYKVIFVTIELRHAPWFGVFQDLSAPDPTSIFNLFGLFPWGAPDPASILSLVFIGILPIGLGVSMWLQMKLNPAPPDKTQAMIFAWMPWVFMFVLGSFASGLVIYWIANNVITFTQQYFIMRLSGHKPDLFGNILGSRKSGSDEKPK